MSQRLKVRTVRPLMFHGARVEPGTILTVDAIDAANLVEGGYKAVLIDEADHHLVLAARRAEVSTMLRQAGRASLGAPGSPWQEFAPRIH